MEEVQGYSNNGSKKNDEVQKEIRVWCDGCYDMVKILLKLPCILPI